MRTDEQMVQSALGDPTFRLRRRVAENTPYDQHFHIYEVELPQSFHRGFPPSWQFVLLSDTGKVLTEEAKQAVIGDALSIINRRPTLAEPMPMAMLSSENSLRLADELPFRPNVFYLDEPDLPERPRRAEPRVAPLIMAMRRTFSQSESALQLCPYVPNKPAQRWRFFGRHRELQRLLYSSENFIVVGPRRIGKTSLLREVERRLMDIGQRAYFIDAQDCDTEQQLMARIMEILSVRDYMSLTRRREFLPDRILPSVLRRLSAQSPIVLIIDELGNVIPKMKGDEWKVLGILRHFAQSGRIRIIGSAFQEFFLKQQEDYSGPWVNFASSLLLTGLSKDDLDDFVVKPFTLWADIKHEMQLRDLIISAVGSHPLLLQYLCQAIFIEIVQPAAGNVIGIARSVVGENLTRYFSEPVEEIFFTLASSTIRYLFVTVCSNAEARGAPLHQVILGDDVIESVLRDARINSTTRVRHNLLRELEIRGLTQPVSGNHSEQQVMAPLVYRYLKRTLVNLDRLIDKYRQEMLYEASAWGLTPMPG
jgi:AAA domain